MMPGYKYPSLRTTLPVAAYYARFDGGAAATDQFAAASANHGTLTDATRVDSSGLAYSFDGVNDYTDYGTGINIYGLSKFTCSFWIYKTSNTAGWVLNRYNSSVAGGEVADYFGVVVGTSLPRAAATFAGANVNNYIKFDSPDIIALNTWHHVVIAVDLTTPTNTTITVNGVQQSVTITTLGTPPSVFKAQTSTPWTSSRITGVSGNHAYSAFLADDILLYPVFLSSTEIDYLASQRGAIYETEGYAYPTLRAPEPVAAYCARLDTGSSASDQFTADGTQNGTLTGGATRVDSSGLAYSFDGVDDYIDSVGTVSSFNFIHTTAVFTLAAWVKFDVTTRQLFLGNTLTASENGFFVALDTNGSYGTKALRISVFGGTTGYPILHGTTADNIINDTNWHHIAYVASGVSNRAGQWFVDGVAVTTVSTKYNVGDILGFGELATGNANRVLNIGRSNWTSTVAPIDGCIDDVLIYPVALTAAQVANLASQRAAIYLPSGYRYPTLRVPEPVAGYYARRDYSAEDQFGANDGTLIGGATRVNDGGLAYSFDGTSGYLKSNLSIGASLTVSFWLKTSGTQSTVGVMQVASDGDLSSGGPSLLLQRESSTTLRWFIQNGYRISFSCSVGVWTHISIAWNGSLWTAYKDGVSVGTYSGGVNAVSNQRFYFGNGYNGYTNCLIDGIVIYSRALSGTEVGNLASTRGAEYSGSYPSLADAVAGYYARSDSAVSLSSATALDQFNTTIQNGTLTNGAVRVDDGGLAYSFDGVDDYIRVASSFPTWRSVSLWVKPPATRAFSALLDSYEAVSFNAGLVLFSNADGTYQFDGRDSGGYKSSGASAVHSAADWIHIVGNTTASRLQIWISGVKENEGTIISTPASRPNLNVGGYATADGNANLYFFTGLIDDLVFFNRELTATEIAYLASQRGAIYAGLGGSQRRLISQINIRGTF